MVNGGPLVKNRGYDRSTFAIIGGKPVETTWPNDVVPSSLWTLILQHEIDSGVNNFHDFPISSYIVK